MKALRLNEEADYLPVPAFAKEANVSEKTARQIARDAGALLKIGKSSRVAVKKAFAYMEEEYMEK